MLNIKNKVYLTTSAILIAVGGLPIGYYLLTNRVGGNHAQPTTKTDQIKPNAKIVKVVDGDTVWIEWLNNNTKTKVRIYGIDTPEKYYTGKLYYDAKRCETTPNLIHKFGVISSNHAQLYLHPNQFVKVIPKGVGKYGRLIAVIELQNKTDFGGSMVKDGFSCVYWKNTSKQYIHYLNYAKSHNLGLWKDYAQLMKCLCY